MPASGMLRCRLDACPLLHGLPQQLQARAQQLAQASKRHFALNLIARQRGKQRAVSEAAGRQGPFCCHCDAEGHT